jgi:uncharacterized protein YndB with AHSA1/START domain
MLKSIIAIVVAVVAALLAYAATRPDTFLVQRTADIKASPDRIYAQITDFRKWGTWSPYEKRDPAMKRQLAGAASGVGAVYEWDGNGEVGQGRMEIVEVKSPELVVIQLDFVRPLETRNRVEFTLRPQGDTTHVTWTMKGPSPYVSKLMGVFFDMDALIGRDFESGLASLRAAAEREA